MCFVNDDYDWLAQVVEESDPVAEKPICCGECGRTIQPGETYHLIDLQQYEECRHCYDGECECHDGKCCQCKEPDFGESCSYRRCRECDRFLQAVQEAEEEAGCHRYEARPCFDMMRESIREAGAADAKRYYRKAAARFPELVSSGYLKRLWKSMFGS